MVKKAIKKKYIPNSKEKYMCAKHKKFFTEKLLEWRKEIIKSNNESAALSNLDDNSAHALINVFPYGNTEFSFRLKNGELMSHFPGNSVEFPNVKLKLERKENNFTGSIFLK